jgi:thioredoxin reductase (NADPH)
MKNEYDLIVIGAGAAGLTAGIFAVRSGLETLLIDKGICGGLSNEAPSIDNYPGFKWIGGMELMGKMKEHALEYVEIRELEAVNAIERGKGGMKVITDKDTYRIKAVILSTGTKHRKLDVPGETEFLGKGISYCATCDGFFFKDKSVLVVGGGDSAVKEALFLNNIGCTVTLVHRRDKLRAEPYVQTLLEKAGISILWNSLIKEIKGDTAVSSIVRYDTKSEVEDELPVEGVFISIGEEPVNDLAKQMGIKLDNSGYIITDKNQRTNLARVYAAGDVTGGVRQIIVACAEGAIAATSAYTDLLS